MIKALPKAYLVTGGCGFIGSHLVDALISLGHRVVILDNLSTGRRENAHPAATLIVGDAADPEAVRRAFDGIDGCFHLAAIASVEQSVLAWAQTHRANVTAAVTIFETASKSGKIPVVYASSAAVYGEAQSIPLKENAPLSPITAYGADKLSCELHAKVAWHVHQVPTVGLRAFNVYGPRQLADSPYSGVISIFVNHMLSGKPITIFGDGNQLRDFVYINDAVKCFLAAMMSLENSKYPVQSEIFNVCTGQASSINELRRALTLLLGDVSHYNYAAARKGDIAQSVGDPSYLNSCLGVKLAITLEQGLGTMLKEKVLLSEI